MVRAKAEEIEEVIENSEPLPAGSKPTSIEELPGVGPKTAEKLRASGYADLMTIAASSPGDLEAVAEIGEETARKVIAAAREALDMGFETAAKLYERRKNVGKVTTGSKVLDQLLGGGLETQSVMEAFGAFSSGKTQLGLQLAVNVQLPASKGGLEANCLWIDTEGTFRPERVKQLAEAAGLDGEESLRNVFVAKAYNSDHQVVLAEKAEELIKSQNVRLVVIDSMMSHFRSDFTGRGELAPRQQKLNRHLHALQKLADLHNIAIFFTNQVMARPDIMFGDPTTAVGGHVIGHFATYRVYLRKSKGEKRIARLIDSPHLPEGEAVFNVTPEGIRD